MLVWQVTAALDNAETLPLDDSQFDGPSPIRPMASLSPAAVPNEPPALRRASEHLPTEVQEGETEEDEETLAEAEENEKASMPAVEDDIIELSEPEGPEPGKEKADRSENTEVVQESQVGDEKPAGGLEAEEVCSSDAGDEESQKKAASSSAFEAVS